MQGIESAIRNALAKADSTDPAMRQRIYESVWSAHERAMAANARLSDQQRTERRDGLKNVISRVEQEMRSLGLRPAAAERQAAPQYDGGLGMPDLDREDIRPRNNHKKKNHKKMSRRRAQSHEPDLGYEPDIQPTPRKKRKNSRFLSLVLPLGLLLTAGFIGWSFYNSFVPLRSGPLSQPAISSGPALQGNEADRKDWQTLFTAAQADRISVQGRATVEIGGSGNARYARIKSPGTADTVSFDIGKGVLDQLRGKQAIFEVILRSDDGGTVQMSVSCDFGTLGNCGRKRYDVTDQQSSLLFDMTMPETKPAKGSGRIIFISDMSGAGKSVDIYAIRVKTTP